MQRGTGLIVGLLALCLLSPGVPAQKKKARLPRQYKRVHQKTLRNILGGKAKEAEAQLQAFIKRHPDDAESYYMLAGAFAQQGKKAEAATAVQKSLQLGLPGDRIILGTRMVLDSLRDHPTLQELRKKFAHKLVHGPMLGCVSGKSIKVWVRTADEARVEVIASKSPKFTDAIRSGPAMTSKKTDYTAVVPVTGLHPSTRYHYKVVINGKDTGTTYTFHTFSPTGKPGKFRLAFGGGAGYVPEHERMWNTIREKKPDVLMLLGDNVYIDDPKTPQMQHYCYYRRQSRPEFRQLTAQVPVYSIWDDHDFGTNDCSGGPEIDRPAWKRPVYRVYRNNWVNPGYGGGEKHPGCYYDFSLADVHFIMLDGRYYRNHKPDDKGRPSMLGPVQRKWLLETIKNTRGKLVVLCSPVPWVFKAKGKSKDTWNGFQKERNEIFDFLAENKIDGVLLMSADRHRSDLWKIERAKGYPLYEFNSSRLTNQHVHGTMKAALFSYNKKQSFGLVDFDTTVADPTVTYRVVTIDGEQVHKFTVKRSQLTDQKAK